ncbi:Post-segregation antitoxin CcdA [Rhizobium sp. CF080]|uniref:type II toxin-antitoxin system CcdA family antitoxin n=1 Tax=Rhizobium sp. (strain CF080) TaxID=1144310 RepID=UPI000271D6E1|nr:type II toxin-antitoxin system CcdA family antitoxin [Rhizobium sp. CF080]EUC00603.1 Post-segregation antitoxin CcdA [Rhizobium sp. CF080]
MSQPARKSTRLSLDANLVSEACALKIDISRAAEEGMAKAIKAEREHLWRLESAEAIRFHNEYVEKHGLPHAKYRQF